MTTHLPTHAEVLDAAQLLREYFQSMPCGQASLPRIAAMLERLAPLLDASAGGVSDAVVDNFREAYFDAADIPDVLTDKVAVRAALTSVLPLLRAGDRCAEFHLALQRIGTALGLLAGSDLTKECVPAIERLRAERAKGEAQWEPSYQICYELPQHKTDACSVLAISDKTSGEVVCFIVATGGSDADQREKISQRANMICSRATPTSASERQEADAPPMCCPRCGADSACSSPGATTYVCGTYVGLVPGNLCAIARGSDRG